MILSIFIGIYDFYISGRPLQISGEIIILVISLIVSYLFQKPKTLKHIQITITIGIANIIGWVITIGLWLSFAQIFKITSVIDKADFDIIVIFMAGLLWNAPIILMFQKALKNNNTHPHLKGLGLHKFLWPVMLAYLVLSTPLLIQDVVNSENWQKMENAKPIHQI